VYEGVGFGTAALEIFPSFFGELGQIESPLAAVQISTVVGILVSVTFVVIVTARITSALVETLRRGGSMARRVKFSGHTIVCGWNFQGKRLVAELLAADVNRCRNIVVVHDTEQRPDMDDRAEFVRGDPSQGEALEAAGVGTADSVIVLTDFDKNMNDSDAEALMVVLAVESLNPDVHTCVQIRNSDNRKHLERARADEIICLDLMGASVAVCSALNHGVSRLLNELLTFNRGSELYRYDRPLSDNLVGAEFADAVAMLAQRRMILIAIETPVSDGLARSFDSDVLNLSPNGDRALIVNPISRYEIRQGDALYVVAQAEPARL
jgi:voltage-gated potassium channel